MATLDELVDGEPDEEAIKVTPKQTAVIEAVDVAVTEVVAAAQVIQVRSTAEAEAATEFLSTLARRKKQVEKARRWVVDPLNAHVKTVNEEMKGSIAPLTEADGIVRAKVIKWKDEQDRIREEAEARVRKIEEEERARADAEKRREEEAARQEREAAAREAEKARAEAAKAADDAGAARRAEEAAAVLEAAREREQAAIDRPPEEVPALEVAKPAPLRTAGGLASSRKRKKATVVDIDRVPRKYLVIDMAAVNKAMHAGIEIPGVTYEDVSSLAVRASE